MIDGYTVEESDNLYQIYYRPSLLTRAVLRVLRGDSRIPVSPLYASDELAWVALAGILQQEHNVRGALFAAEYSSLLHRRKNHERGRAR
ncbi:MAG: hypothetical protein ACXWQ5_00735 [Ktedonobacterales bacterium]